MVRRPPALLVTSDEDRRVQVEASRPASPDWFVVDPQERAEARWRASRDWFVADRQERAALRWRASLDWCVADRQEQAAARWPALLGWFVADHQKRGAAGRPLPSLPWNVCYWGLARQTLLPVVLVSMVEVRELPWPEATAAAEKPYAAVVMLPAAAVDQIPVLSLEDAALCLLVAEVSIRVLPRAFPGVMAAADTLAEPTTVMLSRQLSLARTLLPLRSSLEAAPLRPEFGRAPSSKKMRLRSTFHRCRS